MASMTSAPTAARSASASTMTPRSLPSTPCDVWHDKMGRERYPHADKMHDHRRLRRLQRARACGCGSSNCKRWPMRPG